MTKLVLCVVLSAVPAGLALATLLSDAALTGIVALVIRGALGQSAGVVRLLDLLTRVISVVVLVIGGVTTILSAIALFLVTLDAIGIDTFVVSGRLSQIARERRAILVTRGEYVGGHPLLPEGRVLYLSLEGKLQSPQLSLLVPRGRETAPEPSLHSVRRRARKTIALKEFPVPLLELIGMERPKEEFSSLGNAVIESILTRRISQGWRGERLYLVVQYLAEWGKQQEVTFTAFSGGKEEVQRWSNYIVCAAGEAARFDEKTGAVGEMPYGRWKSLPVG